MRTSSISMANDYERVQDNNMNREILWRVGKLTVADGGQWTMDAEDRPVDLFQFMFQKKTKENPIPRDSLAPSSFGHSFVNVHNVDSMRRKKRRKQN